MQTPKLSKIDWQRSGLLVLLVIAIAAALYGWYRPPVTISKTQFQQVPVIHEVEKIRRVTIPGPERVVVVEKEAAAKELDLPWLLDGSQPSPVQGKSEELQVAATAAIPPSRGGVSAVAILNTTTGETTIVAKEQPLPLFGFPNDIAAMVRYGLSAKDGQTANLAASWHFLRVGAFYVGAYGEIDGIRPDAKAMVEVAYKF